MRKFTLCLLLAMLTILVLHSDAHAGRRGVAERWGERFARTAPWHGDYYYAPWGAPTALVVPPTANMQSSFSWGVTQNSVRPIYHQFGRPYPGQSGGASACLPTPRWPAHTDQFGVYYIRGPW
jgi:hypothetical protein